MVVPPPVTADPLVAVRPDDEPSTGVPVVEGIELLISGIQNGSWIEGGLGALSTALDAGSLVLDPIGTLLSYGITWLIEHVKPLSDVLDSLTGDPATVAAHAQTWHNIATSLRQGAGDLVLTQPTDGATWTGAAYSAYHALSTGQQQGIDGLARSAEAIAVITGAAGMLVGLVRGIVCELIAGLLAQLIKLAALALITAGGATAAAAVQVTNLIATCAARVAGLVRALLASLRNLSRISRHLNDLIDHIKQLFPRSMGPALAFDGPPGHWAIPDASDAPKPSLWAMSRSDDPPYPTVGAGYDPVPRDQIPPPLTREHLPTEATLDPRQWDQAHPGVRWEPGQPWSDDMLARWFEQRRLQNHANQKELFRLFVDAEGRLRVAGNNPRDWNGNSFSAGELWNTTSGPQLRGLHPDGDVELPSGILIMDGSGNAYGSTLGKPEVFGSPSILGGVPVVGVAKTVVIDGRLVAMRDADMYYRVTRAHNDEMMAELLVQGLDPHPTFLRYDVLGFLY